MAGSVNKAILIGHLGRDPEIRSTQAGEKIANFSLATSETWKDKNTGERRERTEWHRITVFNPRLAEIVEKFLKKGSPVYVEGSLQTRKWTDNNSIERYTTEVVLTKFQGAITLLGQSGTGGPPPASSPDDYGSARASGQGGGGEPDFNDEIPF